MPKLACRMPFAGEDVDTTVVLGRERYPVNVRYLRDFRSDLSALNRVLVSAGGQRQLALSQLADVKVTVGPSMIRNENGLLTGVCLCGYCWLGT